MRLRWLGYALLALAAACEEQPPEQEPGAGGGGLLGGLIGGAAGYIAALESALGRKAVRRNCSMQPGDMLETYADVEPLSQAVGFRPSTSIETGVARFVEWFKSYHAIA